jgi:hypothetical protein
VREVVRSFLLSLGCQTSDPPSGGHWRASPAALPLLVAVLAFWALKPWVTGNPLSGLNKAACLALKAVSVAAGSDLGFLRLSVV